MTRYQRLLIDAARALLEGQVSAREKRRKVDGILDAVRAKGRRKPPRRPPKPGIATPAVPPCGPLPKQGGAEASLTFD